MRKFAPALIAILSGAIVTVVLMFVAWDDPGLGQAHAVPTYDAAAREEPASAPSVAVEPSAERPRATATSGASTTTTVPPDIEDYWDRSFYSTSDIKGSFTVKGKQFDCIDFYAQHSVRDLLAQGPLPFDPDHLPEAPHPPGNIERNFAPDYNLDDQGNPRSCPKGAVVVSRPSVAEIQAEGGLAAFKSKIAHIPLANSGHQDTLEPDCWINNAPGNWVNTDGVPFYDMYNYDHGVAVQYQDNYGMFAAMPIYSPYVAPGFGEHTDSQIWVETGQCQNFYTSFPDQNIYLPQQCVLSSDAGTIDAGGYPISAQATQSVEVGWMKTDGYPSPPSGDPYLFVQMNADGYYQKACFAGLGGLDHLGTGYCCPSPSGTQHADAGVEGTDCFVAIANSAHIAPMMALTASTYGQRPNELWVQVWNGSTVTPAAPGWWIYVNDVLIGWYPPNAYKWTEEGALDAGTFGPLAFGPSTYMQVGAEVLNYWPDAGHTPTSMCSDYSPYIDGGKGWEYSCYERNVSYIDDAKTFHSLALDYGYPPTLPNQGDLDDPGLCGLYSGSFTSLYAKTGNGSYWVETGLDAGTLADGATADWASFFYVGGGIGSPHP